MNYKKQKRVPLSMIRLWKLSNKFLSERKIGLLVNKNIFLTDFLKYIDEHKNDTL